MLNRSLFFIICLFLAVPAFPYLSLGNPWSDVKSMSDQELIVAIKKLDLSLGKYKLGHTLTEDQLKLAHKKSTKDNYKGTLKFKDGDVGIVADTKNKVILALFLEKKEADKENVKNMIATLMMSFGQPTTMAHKKIIYWAYNSFGLISEETHGKAKKAEELNILATVKFNSKTRIMEDVDKTEKNSIYCIVSSPQLLQRFVNR